MSWELVDPARSGLETRLWRLNLAAATNFVLGGSLFALGAVLAQTGAVKLIGVNITYLAGGVFFSLGGYASILLVMRTIGDPRTAGDTGRVRWWSIRLHQEAWSSAVVLFAGTLLFGLSLVAAFAQGLTPRQSNGWIWLPDILGCVCFLVSGHLAMRAVSEEAQGGRVRRIGWWVVAVNQTGSILFFLAGIASFIRPATSQALDAQLVNWGTFAGAVCFALGGVIQAFDTPTPASRKVS